jgi:hypothetical protein
MAVDLYRGEKAQSPDEAQRMLMSMDPVTAGRRCVGRAVIPWRRIPP